MRPSREVAVPPQLTLDERRLTGEKGVHENGISTRAADSGGTIAELIDLWLKRWDLSIDRS
jgi:hypothetical protein